MRDGLPGLSDADRSVLGGKADFDDVRSLAASWMQRLQDDAISLGSFQESVALAIADVETPAQPPDLVLVCAYVNSGDQSAGHIKLEGAIDMPAVREEITAVMEGGERAFRLRKEKYGF
jgi:hypothetical protein